MRPPVLRNKSTSGLGSSHVPAITPTMAMACPECGSRVPDGASSCRAYGCYRVAPVPVARTWMWRGIPILTLIAMVVVAYMFLQRS